MSDERIDNLEIIQRKMQETLSTHGETIASLTATMGGLKQSVDANTAALTAHATKLNEYSGAQKVVHWLMTAGAAFLAYIFGMKTGAPHP